jgi:hypothetical protein
MKLPPYMKDKTGYCYIATWDLLAKPELSTWFGAVDRQGFAVPGTEPPGRWHGLTVACLASGPSLTVGDCALVREAGVRTITCNDTIKRAPWADIALAADHGWWQQHMHEMPEGPERWTCSYAAVREFPELELFRTNLATRNTGAKAIELAIHLGAKRVVLLGYDCSLRHGIHWHGPHERTTNPDEKTIAGWVGHFELVAEFARTHDVQVLNCSRDTALECFERRPLEDVL